MFIYLFIFSWNADLWFPPKVTWMEKKISSASINDEDCLFFYEQRMPPMWIKVISCRIDIVYRWIMDRFSGPFDANPKKQNSQDEHFIDKNIYLLLVAVNRDRNIQRVRRCCSRIPLCEEVHVRILVLAGLIQTFLKIMRNKKVRKVIKIKYQSEKRRKAYTKLIAIKTTTTTKIK